jgi:IS605 OrfB family transposase
LTEEAGEQGAGCRGAGEKDTEIRLQKGFQAPKFIYAQKPKYLLCLRHAARTRCIAREIMPPCFQPLNLFMGFPLLQRLSGRERRFQQWLNHQISYRIIQQAKSTNAIVAIENLTGIRERTNTQPRNKIERRRSNSWSFDQLRSFLEYKGKLGNAVALQYG